MEQGKLYKFHYNLEGLYIKGVLDEESSEYYVLINAETHLPHTQGSSKIESCDGKCFVSKNQIRYIAQVSY